MSGLANTKNLDKMSEPQLHRARALYSRWWVVVLVGIAMIAVGSFLSSYGEASGNFALSMMFIVEYLGWAVGFVGLLMKWVGGPAIKQIDQRLSEIEGK